MIFLFLEAYVYTQSDLISFVCDIIMTFILYRDLILDFFDCLKNIWKTIKLHGEKQRRQKPLRGITRRASKRDYENINI